MTRPQVVIDVFTVAEQTTAAFLRLLEMRPRMAPDEWNALAAEVVSRANHLNEAVIERMLKERKSGR